MILLDERSLASTIDNVSEAFFFDKDIPQARARELARWLSSRQGLPESYAGMFAPTRRDFADGIRLFTGEKISSRAATGHILGEEACRVSLLLAELAPGMTEAQKRASESMDKRLIASESELGKSGFF